VDGLRDTDLLDLKYMLICVFLEDCQLDSRVASGLMVGSLNVIKMCIVSNGIRGNINLVGTSLIFLKKNT
jgi:hypothetical protein